MEPTGELADNVYEPRKTECENTAMRMPRSTNGRCIELDSHASLRRSPCRTAYPILPPFFVSFDPDPVSHEYSEIVLRCIRPGVSIDVKCGF